MKIRTTAIIVLFLCSSPLTCYAGKCLSHLQYRTYDGSCNHLGPYRRNAGRGTAVDAAHNEVLYGTDGKPLFASTYFRGLAGSEYAEEPLPIEDPDNPGEVALSRIVQRGDTASPRKITNAFVPDHALAVVPSGDPQFPTKVVSVVPEVPNDKGISMLEVVFGQFINHDQEFNLEINTVSNPEGDEERARRESVRIPIPEGDIYRTDPSLTQGNTWPFQIINPSLGEAIHGRFEVYNGTNSWLDLSTIYGKSEEESAALREGARLKVSDYTINHTTAPTDPSAPCQLEVPTGPVSPPVFIDLAPLACVERDPIVLKNLVPSKSSTGLATDVAVTNFDAMCNPLAGSTQPGPDFLAGMPCQSVLDPGVDTDDYLLTSGDPRVNENINLAMMHTLWVREHNRILDVVYNGEATDEAFQKARRLNIALYQQVIYEEYLPALLGEDINAHFVGAYGGYKPWVKPETSMVFATAAFRYGHSAIADYPAIKADGAVLRTAEFSFGNPLDPFVPLSENVFQFGFVGGPLNAPLNLLLSGGEAAVLRGLLSQRGNAIDFVFNESFRTIVNSNFTGMLLDIPATDILRGRLNGVPNYYRLRKLFFAGAGHDIYALPSCEASEISQGPDPIECFEEITADTTTATKLRDIYGKVNNVDAIVGLMLEDTSTAPESELGRTTAVILALEYRRKRDADRFFYERLSFSTPELEYLSNRRFLDVIADNTQAGGRVEVTEAFPFGPRRADFVEQGEPGSMGSGGCLRNLERNSFFVVDLARDCRL